MSLLKPVNFVPRKTAIAERDDLRLSVALRSEAGRNEGPWVDSSGDLPEVEHRSTLEQFLDPEKAQATETALKEIRRARGDNQQQTDQAQLALEAARSASAAARETFANWLKTRDTTQRVDQDPDLIARTQRLDALKAAERTVEEQLEGLAQTDLGLAQNGAEVVISLIGAK